MTTDEAVLYPAGQQDLTDCSTFLDRLIRLDPVGVVRLQVLGEHVTVWAQPLGVVVRREVAARMTVDDRTVSAPGLLAAVRATTQSPRDAALAIFLPTPSDGAWRVTLPPRAGWSVLDAVPVAEFLKVADSAGRLVRAAGDPVAVGESMLDQETLRVSRDAERVVVPLRVLVVLNRLGFLGANGQSGVVRVDCTRTWTRLAARHGTVYQRRNAVALRLA
ncbi:MAG: hypothetical protein WKF47_19440 [Geodermatophilaceae bacterium]|nr:hypothetical protein [Geodermatophilaceae bacterium]